MKTVLLLAIVVSTSAMSLKKSIQKSLASSGLEVADVKVSRWDEPPCASGYTLETFTSSSHGDICRANDGSGNWAAPNGCTKQDSAPYTVQGSSVCRITLEPLPTQTDKDTSNAECGCSSCPCCGMNQVVDCATAYVGKKNAAKKQARCENQQAQVLRVYGPSPPPGTTITQDQAREVGIRKAFNTTRAQPQFLNKVWNPENPNSYEGILFDANNCPGDAAAIDWAASEAAGKTVYGEPTMTCNQLTDRSNGEKDTISCATDISFATSFDRATDNTALTDRGDPVAKNCHDATDRKACNGIDYKNGAQCQWQSFGYANQGVEAGKCVPNPCSNVNDGMCTLQATGGRCVWYKKWGSKGPHPENPFGNWNGCYTSPCTNPAPIPYYKDFGPDDGITTKISFSVAAMVRGCEAMNTYVDKTTGRGFGYKCEWCPIKWPNQNTVLGCQNVDPTSAEGSKNIAISRLDKILPNLESSHGGDNAQGDTPCVNQYCHFYKGSNSNDQAARQLFGDGAEVNQRVCTDQGKNNGEKKLEWKRPECHQIAYKDINGQDAIYNDDPNHWADPVTIETGAYDVGFKGMTDPTLPFMANSACTTPTPGEDGYAYYAPKQQLLQQMTASEFKDGFIDWKLPSVQNKFKGILKGAEFKDAFPN